MQSAVARWEKIVYRYERISVGVFRCTSQTPIRVQLTFNPLLPDCAGWGGGEVGGGQHVRSSHCA